MSKKDSSVLKLKDLSLSNKRLLIYSDFRSQLDIFVKKNAFLVAVSGGPDSLALAFLSKIYSINKSLKVKYLIIDHKLRKNSTDEAHLVKKKLKKISINLEILTWNGKKPLKNIQSIARSKRYDLLVNKSKNFKIKNILLGHHLNDLLENFFIRILRGSGLNGLISLDNKTTSNQINFLRPLINFDKKDLIYISNNIFDSYIKDPSNEDVKFKRVRIRNLLNELEKEGLDKNKFLLTINNLKFSNETIKFYTKKNLDKNSLYLKEKKIFILKESFFHQSQEVIFRSFSEVIKLIGKKYYSVRGKKLDRIISSIEDHSLNKTTLGGCIIQKVSKTVIISKEH